MDKVAILLKLVPALIAAIRAIEEAIPGQGKGEAKLAAVREIIEQADETAKGVWPMIAATVGTLVKLMNVTGAFRKA